MDLRSLILSPAPGFHPDQEIAERQQPCNAKYQIDYCLKRHMQSSDPLARPHHRQRVDYDRRY